MSGGGPALPCRKGTYVQANRQHPQDRIRRHAGRHRLFADVHRLQHPHHARLHQAGLFRAARPAGRLCLRPGVRRGGVPDQEPDEPDLPRQHRRRGRAVQLFAGLLVCDARRPDLPARQVPEGRPHRLPHRLRGVCGPQPAHQLFPDLSPVWEDHAHGSHPGPVSEDQPQLHRLV